MTDDNSPTRPTKRYVTEKTLVTGVAIPLFVFATQQFLMAFKQPPILDANVYTGLAAYAIALGLLGIVHYLDFKRIPVKTDAVKESLEDAAETVGETVDNQTSDK